METNCAVEKHVKAHTDTSGLVLIVANVVYYSYEINNQILDSSEVVATAGKDDSYKRTFTVTVNDDRHKTEPVKRFEESGQKYEVTEE